MLKKIKFKLRETLSEKNKYQIESEIDILTGVNDVTVDYQTGECEIEFEQPGMSVAEIIKSIQKLGYQIDREAIEIISNPNELTYHVGGMHCASCEVLIEKKLLKEPNIKAVDASTNHDQVLIEYAGEKPTIKRLNSLFASDDYTFSDEPIKKEKTKLLTFDNQNQLLINKKKLKNLFVVSGVSILFIIGFTLLHKSGFSALISVNTKSALPMFILFGLLAGFSSCAALVGGIILSMSKQWLENYGDDDSTIKKLQPHILFNVGRIISYGVLGAILGSIGSLFQISTTFTSLLVIGISIIMLFLALQMLGVKYFRKFQLAMPRFITRYIADESNFKGRYMPMLMGAATFFLPCGFTITAQGLALASGSALQGGLIMFFFALGTLPALLAIGLSSITFTKKPHVANRFLKIAGVIVLFFVVFNVNAQLNVLGLKSLDDISFESSKTAIASEDGLPEIVNGKQILKMDALSFAYEPSRLKVRAGIPVRWEITDKGTSGCTNAVMSKGLFEGQIDLTPGKVSTKEFTPEKAGRYKFSCWMGMISGVIDVVDLDSDGSSAPLLDDEIIPSGAKGCGCGGGGTGSCGA
jgi:sulfite exporter TauE/SafE/copper chaperone CopZ